MLVSTQQYPYFNELTLGITESADGKGEWRFSETDAVVFG